MGEDGATVGLKGDSWFGSINTCDQLGARGKMGVFQMKKAHSLYQKKKKLRYQAYQEEFILFRKVHTSMGNDS